MLIEPLSDQGPLREAKILLIDDHDDAVTLLQQTLRKAGYENVFGTTDSRETVAMCTELSPDLLILDLNMPPPSGYDVLDQLVLRPGKKDPLAILVLTADITPMAKLKALSLGAKDFLTKPFERVDLLLRVRNLLEAQLVQKQLESARHHGSLEPRPHDRNEVQERLFMLVDCINPKLAERSIRVSGLSGRLAKALGLPAAEVQQIENATRLFDIGMVAFPESAEAGPMQQERRALLRGHVTVAEHLLGRTPSGIAGAKLPFEIATCHHERWDGSGYPLGLSGEEIPLAARIVSVAHTIDTILHPEYGKRPISMAEAVTEIVRQAGFAFDPSITATLQRVELAELTCV